jgi:1-phosphatidylinositol-5-phosphate 4-kinase
LIFFFKLEKFSCDFLASQRRELYSLGLIDILTYYGMKKKSAHVAKTKLTGSDADAISTVRPEIYARRFLDFVDRHFT